MAVEHSPVCQLPYILPSQSQKHVTHNEALAMLDVLVQMSVSDRDLATPPVSPAEGDRYIVAAAPTGAWVGQAGRIAYLREGAWDFLVPQAGFIAFVLDEATLIYFDGAAWANIAAISPTVLQSMTLLGVGATADAVNPFTAKLNKALWTAKTVAEGGDGDLRYTLNKEAASDVVSFLMQRGFSGRAELGLIGDDDLSLKVSSDGASWKEAVRVDRTSGVVTFGQTGSMAHLAKNLFEKADGASVAFTKTGAGAVSIKAGTIVEIAGLIYAFAVATAVQMPTLTAGTDYAIYVCNDGSVRADASFTAPSGFTTTSSRQIGGFHYAPGANATGTAGGTTTPAINEHSLWDVKWRPSCSDPRGMALVAGKFWCDIYLLGVNHHSDGTSRNNVTIADGSSPPKIPAAFGGNGSTTYGGLTWWEAAEVMESQGKRLLSYSEFAAAAYGVTENQDRGNDPVTTGFGTTNAGSNNADHKQTSKWGIIQATGVMWVWGDAFGGPDAGAAFANTNGGRGQVYQQSNVALFGGYWITGANAGSRASFWSAAPSGSGNNIGARGACDHRQQA